MATDKPKFTIVGAGLSGALMAAYLGQMGYEVEMFEKRPDPHRAGTQGGRSINLALSTRGIRALQEVGVAEQVLASAVPMRGRMMHAPDGRLTFQPYGTSADQVINSVSRGGLNMILLEAAGRHPSVRLHFDSTCVGADLDTGAALRTTDDIRAAVERLEATGADVCVTAYEADHNPYYNMVELDPAGLARVCIPPERPIANRQQAPAVYSLSPAIFAIRRDALWRHDHWSQCKMTLSVIPRERALDIDTELDFTLVELLFARRAAR